MSLEVVPILAHKKKCLGWESGHLPRSKKKTIEYLRTEDPLKWNGRTTSCIFHGCQLVELNQQILFFGPTTAQENKKINIYIYIQYTKMVSKNHEAVPNSKRTFVFCNTFLQVIFPCKRYRSVISGKHRRLPFFGFKK